MVLLQFTPSVVENIVKRNKSMMERLAKEALAKKEEDEKKEEIAKETTMVEEAEEEVPEERKRPKRQTAASKKRAKVGVLCQSVLVSLLNTVYLYYIKDV